MNRLRVVPALAAAVAVAAACTAGTSNVAPRPAAPGATPGGTIVVGITLPGSLDPSNAYEAAGDQVMATVCEPLLTFDPLTGVPRAGIASSWIITDGGKLISIRMRSGVHYQDGGTVNSTDVLDELSRVANVTNASYDAPLLQDVKGYDEIHGDTETDNGLALRQLTGIQTISNTSFSIALTNNDADLLNALGDLIAAPVPRKLADGDPGSLLSDPVCAGPYEMAAPWHSGQTDIVVKRFAGYYAHNSAYPRGGVGYPDTIDFRVFSNQAAEMAAFAAGQLDIAGVADGVGARAAGATVVSAANGYVEYLGLPNDVDGSVFASPAVHTALSQALDRQALAQAAYGGGALPASGFFPPTVGGVYQPGACGPATPATANAAAARATLARAGVNLTGRTLTLHYNDQFQNRELAEAIAAQWTENLGLHVTLVPQPWDAYVTAATTGTGFDGAFLESWQAPYPSPDGYLYPLFDSASVGTDNFAHVIDPTFDRSITDVARQATSDASRVLAYQHLAANLCRSLPMIPLVDRESHYAIDTTRVGSAIGSFTDASSGLLDLREVYVRR